MRLAAAFLLTIAFSQAANAQTINFVEWIGGLAKLTVETSKTVQCVAFYGAKKAGSGTGYPTRGVAELYISVPSSVNKTAVKFKCYAA